MTITQAFTNSLLADATYALGAPNQVFLTGATGTQLTGYLADRMTPTLAKYLCDKFTVVTHIETGDILGSGFDATVWKENATGKLSISMQGASGLQDFLSDLNLAVSGGAQAQLVSMVNWWLSISTPVGQSATQIRTTIGGGLIGQYFEAAPSVPGTGLISASNLIGGIEVNGHSLGANDPSWRVAA